MTEISLFDNLAELTDHGNMHERKAALAIAEAGIKSVIPYVRTKEYVSLCDNILTVGSFTYDLDSMGSIYVVGVGKGSFPIAQALDEILGERIKAGFLVVKEGEKRRLPHVRVFESSHPFPDERSVTGAKGIMEILKQAKQNDIIFAAVTGGASALVNLPVDPVTIDELRQTNKLLLQSGADIRQMNAVRKHLCNMKGGRVVQFGQPAMVITFTLDTNPPGLPWPDLCLPDPSTFAEAIEVLHDFQLWDKVPASVRSHLEEGLKHPEWETLKSLDGMNHAMFNVGNQQDACLAAATKARELGYEPIILSSTMEGEAKDVGIMLAGVTNEVISYGRPLKPPCAIISGGETTITIVGKPEEGGPNQETAFGYAYKLRTKDRMAFVCIDTDGTDGPTDIAGGISDGHTLARLKEQGLSIAEIFKTHGTAEPLRKLRDAIYTGNTGTNVMNLRVVVIGAAVKE